MFHYSNDDDSLPASQSAPENNRRFNHPEKAIPEVGQELQDGVWLSFPAVAYSRPRRGAFVPHFDSSHWLRYPV